MSGEQNETNSSTVFFSRSRLNKVRPFSAGTSESIQVEIRPKRLLRIQHINARPRDAKFEKEMQMQMLYKQQGLPASGGPLSMPKRKPVREASTLNDAQGPTELPNSINHNNVDNSALREISASGSKGHFTSHSNVHVAVKTRDSGVSSDPVYIPENMATEKENNVVNASNNKSTTATEKEDQGKSSDSGVNSSVADAGDTITKEDPKSSESVPTVSQTTPRHLSKQKTDSTSIPNGTLSSRIPSTVLFFFHGVGGSSDVWQAQIRHFAREGYEIVAPDLIGHGMSCTPQDPKSYHFQETAADMEEIFDKYCKKRNILIGHSYGCSFAVVLARRRSRRVQKLVLISGGAPTPLAPQPGVFSLPSCVLGCIRPCLNQGFNRSAFHKKSQPVVEKEEAFSIPTYVLQHTMNGQDWPDGDELYHQWLLCSILLIYGAQDKLVTLNDEKHMEEVIFRSRLEVIPNASHMVMIEAPDEVNHLLLNFFREDSTLATTSNSPQPPVQHQPLDRSVSRMSIKSTKSHKTMPSHYM